MKKCISCGEEIHPKRLEILPNATRCVACSTTNRKAGVSVMKGEGDHTYVETIIMERDEFIKYQEAELKARGQRPDDFQHPDDFIKESNDKENNIEDEDSIEPDLILPNDEDKVYFPDEEED
jgi:hypothetical protein